MNENLQSVPDEHLEARITACILGEASPFEAAEIEELIAKSPELKLFANRLRILNGLIKEAETTANSPDAAWKLSGKRRIALAPVLGPVPVLMPGRENRIRRASFRAAFGIAAVLLITFFISPMVIRQRKMAVRMEEPAQASYMAKSPVDSGDRLESLRKAVREQEDKVEERRKVLTTITRTKDISYRGDASLARKSEIKKEALERNTDAQDYADAKHEFERDLTVLEQMKSKLGTGEIAEGALGEKGELAALSVPSSRPVTPAVSPAPALSKNGSGTWDGSNGGGVADEAQEKALAMNEPRFRNDSRQAGAVDSFAAPSGMAGAPSEPEGLQIAGIATGGLRSGDEAITRNNIDAILNNPERSVDAFSDSPATPSAEPMDAGAAGGSEDIVRKSGERALGLESQDMLLRAETDPFSVAGKDAEKQASDFQGKILYGNKLDADAPADMAVLVPAKGKKETSDKGTKGTVPPDMNSFFSSNISPDTNMGLTKSGAGATTFTGTNSYSGISSGVLTEIASGEIANLASDLYSDTSDPTKTDGGIEYEIHTGYKSEYLFRGLDLAEKAKEPKPINLADLSQEIPATQEPFSTFSLNISDASFQVASSAVAKGERPDPESIKPEQFYNAVPYDDPAPSTGEPVDAAIGQVAHPVIPGRNLVRMSVRTASTGRAATQPLVLTLLVDQSGSMARADRRAAMDTALTQLATLMQPDDRITVIGFSRTPRLLADSISGDDAEKLPEIINQAASEGGTNIEQALNLAENLALRHKLGGAQNRIVLFTDGAANLGNADPERLAERVKSLRQQDLAFDIAGIGTDDINDKLLSELARHGNGRYYLVGENTGGNLAKQLAGAFRPAAENVKIQVKFNPQRVGNYKLIGFEKDRLKTEDFRNDSVDAAELAADESGTALYQVEPLADGSGEIGELFVRFRDTATGEMVERSWTIPYESQAPAIDKAQPPMQLAALSLLAAQKLQPGPLADAINFRELSTTIAAVKQAYSHSPEAQQMITLINALK